MSKKARPLKAPSMDTPLKVEAIFRRNPSARETGYYRSLYWGNNDRLPQEWEDIVNSQPFAKLAMDMVARYVIGNGFRDYATAIYNTDVLEPKGSERYVSLQDFVIACTKQCLLYDGSFAIIVRRGTDGTICAVENAEHLAEMRKAVPGHVENGMPFVWYPNIRLYRSYAKGIYYHAYRGTVITPEEQAEIEAAQIAANGAYFGEVLWHYIPAYGVQHYPIPKQFNGGEIMLSNGATGRAILSKAKVQWIPSVIISTPVMNGANDSNGSNERKDFQANIAAYNESEVVSNVMHLEGSPGNMPQVTVLNTTEIVGPLTEAYDATAKQILMMYGVDPALAGYATAGQLGNNQQLSIAEQRLNELAKLTRNTVFDVVRGPIDAMAQVMGITLDWTIVPLELYKSVPAEKWEVMTPEERREYYGLPAVKKTNSIAEILTELPEFVANKVLEVMSQAEKRELAGLNPMVEPPALPTPPPLP